MYRDSVHKKTFPVIDLQAGNEKLDVSTYFFPINPDPEPHPDPFLWEMDPDVE